jgi:class 3 adenylate cyclase
VTLLFTDIEGSTSLLKALGDRFGELLDDHRRLLRQAFRTHGGHELDVTGDGFLVAFPRAADAVRAAAAGRRLLAAHRWPDGLECRVRMGLHTGEASAAHEGYFGMVFHHGARVAAVAAGGQILLSSVVAELVRDDLPPGLVLHGLGWRRLKDIDRPEHLHALVEAAPIEAAVRLPQPRPCDWTAPLRASGLRGPRGSAPSLRAARRARHTPR